jgi:hypothetical protein
MNGDDFRPTYRLAVREERGAWSWTLLRGETVAMAGEAAGLEDAVRRAEFAAGAHAAFKRIGRKRF